MKQDEQHHDIELDPELQGILDLINNISDDELDKQLQTWDEILAPQSTSLSPAATLPRQSSYDPFSDD